MALCIVAKHLHFGLICPEDIVTEVLRFVYIYIYICSFFSLLVL